VVIVCEFHCVKKLAPIVLLVIAEHVDVGLNPFVVVLHLSLGLWVIGCGEPLIDVQCFEEPSNVICHECGSPICVMDFGDTMQFPHMS
jgi:hypothetical protein